MATKRITDVDYIHSLNGNESFFINQNSSIKQINKRNIVFGINNGGTGATSVAGARNALGLGNTDGALPIANGGTGATTAEEARVNLGIIAMTSTQVRLDGWDDNQKIVSVNGVTANNTVFVSPESNTDGYKAYAKCNVRCISQATNTLTFICDKIPDIPITVNVVMFT